MQAIPPPPRPGFESAVFAKNQPEYLQLPAITDGFEVETLWKLSFRERVKVFFTGMLYISLMTFGQKLQPIRVAVDRDPRNDMQEAGNEENQQA